MYLPRQIGPATTWALSDFGRKWVDTPPAANGTALVPVATVPQDELWLVDWVRVSASPIAATADVRAYLCHDTENWDVMGTSTGKYDVADQNSPIQCPGGVQIVLVWKDMPNGATGRGYVQWTVMRQGGDS
ncbi:hypothetical protein ABZ341_41655 [Streptomyces sp. NPDC006173]|uniref:hypothetical protein n=1 Tax=Streptomyces sp. NPDC006173 TaxID=3155349 RepID=UPI0033F11F8E